MFPDPKKSSIADEISHHMATEEIIGVGKLSVFCLYYDRNSTYPCSVFSELVDFK